MRCHYVYIVECSDKTLYTGWTRDVAKRVREHNSGKCGAKYTKSRRPVKSVYIEKCASLSEALKREAEIKKLSRKEKILLIHKGGRHKKLVVGLRETKPNRS